MQGKKHRKRAQRVESIQGQAKKIKLATDSDWAWMLEHTKTHKDFDSLYASTQINSTIFMDLDDDDDEGTEEDQVCVYGLDCEMVLCRTSGVSTANIHRLARLSLVRYSSKNKTFEVVIDSFVAPPQGETVVDYLTYVSGVKKEDLEEAMSVKSMHEMLKEKLHKRDIVVGHSLWSDYKAIGLWHPRTVDTSFFFSVKDLGKLTLGLQDVMEHCGVSSTRHGNQAHDSTEDAVNALKVALYVAARRETVEMDLPPSRLQCRLTVTRLSEDMTVAKLKDMLGLQDTEGVDVRPLKQTSSISKYGWSSIVTFASPAQAQLVFKQAPLRDPLHDQEGWPAHPNGFLRKVMVEGELLSYIRPRLQHKEIIKVSDRAMGRVMGKQGATINAIQKRSGVQIRTSQENKANKLVIVLGDNLEKVEAASQLVEKAIKGQFSV